MRKPLVLSLALVLTLQAVALSQPSPLTSTAVLGGMGSPCQYRFRADGGLDDMTVTVTLLTAAGIPVPAWPTTCTLVVNAGTLRFCSCCPNPQAGLTDAAGEIVFTWSKIGGRGTLDAFVAAAPIAFVLPLTFTSPDLSGSCEAAPLSSTTVLDLGIWAGGLAGAALGSDYNCSGTITIVDLGVFAGGLGWGCGPPCP